MVQFSLFLVIRLLEPIASNDRQSLSAVTLPNTHLSRLDVKISTAMGLHGQIPPLLLLTPLLHSESHSWASPNSAKNILCSLYWPQCPFWLKKLKPSVPLKWLSMQTKIQLAHKERTLNCSPILDHKGENEKKPTKVIYQRKKCIITQGNIILV